MYSDPFDYSEFRDTTSWVLLLAAIAGLIARFVCVANSWGTDDVDLWWRYAETIHYHGIFEIYQRESTFHYPLLTALLIHGAYIMSELTGLSFPLLLRIPGALTDCALTVLLYRLLSPYGFRTAAWGAAAYGASLLAILVSGYHGAIEPTYVFLTFAAFVLLEARGRPAMAGIVLGVACNIKLLPLLFLPALLTGCRSLKDALVLALGAVIGLVPLFYGAWQLGPIFMNQVLFFEPGNSDWNAELLLEPLAALWSTSEQWKEHLLHYHALLGRSILVACLAAFALRELIRPVRTPLHVAAISFCLFSLLAPGFVTEYALIGAAFFAATMPGAALLYGATAGVWAATAYWNFAISTEPWRSVHTGTPAWSTTLLGVATWCCTAYLLYRLWRSEDLHQQAKAPFFADEDFM